MPKAMLLVDDSATIRMLVKMQLKPLAEELTITEAANGKEALERIGESSFDVIFTDLNMPELDGFELIRKVRALPQGSTVPIVVLSTRDAEDDLDRAFAVGASSFIGKPVQGTELRDAVRRHLGIG